MSLKCTGAVLTGSAARGAKPNVICPICGKAFHLKPSKILVDKHHYCSRECLNSSKKQYMRGSGNHQYGLKGEKNSSWRGGVKVSNYGYRLIRCIDHPFGDKATGNVFEHRLIAERYLLTDDNSVVINGKRYLSPDYDVHHINHIRTDNRIENLKVMKSADHRRLHATEQLRRMKRDSKGRFIKLSAGDS